MGRLTSCGGWISTPERRSIFSIRPDGSGLEQLTDDEFDACWHTWSPDGGYLAYDGTDAEGHYDIYLRDTESGPVTRLTHDPRSEQAPLFVVTTDDPPAAANQTPMALGFPSRRRIKPT